ncbi:MAG TPA: NAD-dependent epimerase/dehydratase family protein [Candidatus Bathyarchaeia archaeon]
MSEPVRILLTGANGFVGVNLGSFLSKSGLDVLRTDISSSDVNGDLTDASFVLEVLGNQDFDSVVHLAGLINVPKSIDDPYTCYRINCLGTLNLLEMASRKKVERFIYVSSNNVYGLPRRLPLREDDSYNPRSPYDYSKVVAEHFVKSFHMHKQLPTVVLRSWKMFGPHDVPTAAVPRFIRACISGEPIPLYNGGKDVNDVYYVDNFCKAVTLALKNPKAVGETFNVGSGREISVLALAREIRRMTRSRSKLQIMPPRTPLESKPMRTRPSIAKIQRVLGYRPVVGLREGLKKTIEWYRAN